jgi:hypothetical protein
MVTKQVAEKIAGRLRRDGFDRCTAEEVMDVAKSVSIEPSVIGEDYDAALESRILQELEEYGFS